MQEIINKFTLPVKLRITGDLNDHEPEFLSRMNSYISHPIVAEKTCAEEYYAGCSCNNTGYKTIFLFSHLANLQFYVSESLLTRQREKTEAVETFGPKFTLSNIDVVRLLKFDYPQLVVDTKKENIYCPSPKLPRRTTLDCTVPIMPLSDATMSTEREGIERANTENFDNRRISMKSASEYYTNEPVTPLCKRILNHSAPQLDHTSDDDSIGYTRTSKNTKAKATAALQTLSRNSPELIVEESKTLTKLKSQQLGHQCYNSKDSGDSAEDCLTHDVIAMVNKPQVNRFATIQKIKRGSKWPFRTRRKLSQAKSDTEIQEKPDSKCISRNASINTPIRAKTVKRRPADPLPTPHTTISASVDNLFDDERIYNIDSRPPMPLPQIKKTSEPKRFLSALPCRPPPLPPRACLSHQRTHTTEDSGSEPSHDGNTSSSYEDMARMAPGSSGHVGGTINPTEDTYYVTAKDYKPVSSYYGYKKGRYYRYNKRYGEFDSRSENVNIHERITSGLSTSQLIKHLKSLKLNVSCDEKIQDQAIDGSLLLDMSKQLIQDSLKVTKLDALKIFKFAHKGWSPLLNSDDGF
ncbi:uncharacterized protein [Antedon mediterranea]|uniref:uncharacterized protein n=1 Tax=Antedon mediterranea TaxID=105859 RepID=UPI003AF93945